MEPSITPEGQSPKPSPAPFPPTSGVEPVSPTLPALAGPSSGPGSLPSISRTRLLLALIVAALSDLASLGAELLPPLQMSLDLVTAVLLFMILGWRWLILPGLIAEAMPGLGIFPTWVLVVISIGAWGNLTRAK